MNFDATHKTMLVAIVIMVAVIVWMLTRHVAVPEGEYTPATVAPEVKGTQRVAAHMKTPPKVLDKTAKDKLGVSKDKINNAAISVVMAIKVFPDPHSQTAVVFLNENTGEFSAETRVNKYDFLYVEQTGHVGFGYGYKSGNNKVIRLMGDFSFIQIKGWNLGFDGTLDSDRQMYGGFHAIYGF